MSNVLSNLEPEKVFYYFEQLCQIPHGSGNTKEISDYCVSFAKEHNLNYVQDDANNVIIFKEASKGYEDRKTVIIQGHLDMVTAKTAESTHDFNKDPLDLRVDGDSVHCKDTTLGGDDGIAVAMGLAILADDTIEHPALEAVFTVDEEIGLLGATALDVTPLHGSYMLNLDSEEEGIFTVGCAGGVTAQIGFEWETTNIEGITSQLIISGLNGGHSGTGINKGHMNAHKVIGRLFHEFDNEEVYFGIESIQGGNKDNVIPNQCEAVIVLPDDDDNYAKFEKCAQKVEAQLRKEYAVADNGIKITTVKEKKAAAHEILNRNSAQMLTYFLNFAPNGIQYMNQSIPGLVETSLNMGILSVTGGKAQMGYSVRSAVKSSKFNLMERVKYFTEFLGGECTFVGEYPAWEYRTESKLRDIACESFERLYHKKPVVETIHAGVECGIFEEKFQEQGKELDIISMGPDLTDIHTVNESLSISSTQRTWELVLDILKNLK